MKYSWKRTVFFCLFLIFLMGSQRSMSAQTDPKNLIDMVIILDRSGSMRATDPKGLSIPAASFILEQLALSNSKNRAAVIPFSNQAHILGQENKNVSSALTSNFPGLIEMMSASMKENFNFRETSPDSPEKFNALLQQQMKETGYTELGMALSLAEGILTADEPGRRKVIVLISDGNPEPNIKDKARLKDLETIVGKDLVQNFRKTRAKRDVRTLNKKYSEKLIEREIRSMKEKNISVYPVAFVKEGGNYQVLESYLDKVREITTGERGVIIATDKNLIEKLIGFIPSTSNHVQLYAFKGEDRFLTDDQRLSTKEFELVIPEIASQARFFFSYPTARPSHNVKVELFRDNVKVADSQSPQGSGIIFNTLLKRDGSLAYQSFKFINKVNAAGTWKIRLTDLSQAGAEHLPDTDLLVDIRSDTDLDIEIDEVGPSGQLMAENPLTFRFKLFGRRDGKEYTLPITKVDAFIIGRSPDDISNYSDKLRDFDHSENVAAAKWGGFPTPGTYRFRGKVFFDTVPKTIELFTLFDRTFKVDPAEPVDAWFGKRGRGKSLFERNPDLKFELSPLGENFEIEFAGAQIETRDNRTINTLRLSIDPFQHPETGASLSNDWVKLHPEKIRGLSWSRAIPVRLKVELPDAMPSQVTDGVYKSFLYLKTGVSELDSTPLFLSVSIPRYVSDPGQANEPYLGGENEAPLTIEKTIYYPGDAPHTFSIPLWSSSIPGVEAKPVIESEKALALKKDDDDSLDEGRPRFDRVTYQVSKGYFHVPGKNVETPGIVKAEVILQDPSLNGQSFENIMLIEGKHHRTRIVRLITHIKFIEAWKIYSGAALILLAALVLGFSWFGLWWKNRELFDGYEYDSNDAGLELNREISYKGPVGNLTYNQNNGQLNFKGYNEFTFNDDVKSPDSEVELKEMDTIGLTEKGKAFTISVTYVDETGYGYSVHQSDLKAWRGFVLLFPAVFLALFSIYVFIKPYGLLNLFRI